MAYHQAVLTFIFFINAEVYVNAIDNYTSWIVNTMLEEDTFGICQK